MRTPLQDIPPRYCAHCEAQIEPQRIRRIPWIRFCSKECGMKHRVRADRGLSRTLVCVHCGNSIPSTEHAQSKYCSAECRKQAQQKSYRLHNPRLFQVSTSTMGAISELRVAVDLLQQGYAVFRALSPSCPCDLAILLNGTLLRIEVKTAYRTTGGQIMPRNKPQGTQAYDVLACVLPDSIIYKPDLSSPGASAGKS